MTARHGLAAPVMRGAELVAAMRLASTTTSGDAKEAREDGAGDQGGAGGPTADASAKTDASEGEGDGAGKAESGSEEEGAEEEEDEDAKYEQGESLPVWQTMAMLVALGLAGWFGSFTIAELIPTATAPQSIRQRAVAVLEGDPDVVERFGKVVRSYGAGYGGERGRRNFVQSYTYTRGGTKFTRVKFMVETDEKRKGVVYAEVSHSAPKEWSYLMLDRAAGRGGRRRRSDTVVVLDNRKPEKPLAVRQKEVVSRLLSSGGRLYHGGPLDAHGQGQIRRFGDALGEPERASLLVDCSREINERRCEEMGFGKGQSPVWSVRVGGADVVKRQKVLELEDLEELLGLSTA